MKEKRKKGESLMKVEAKDKKTTLNK